MKIIYAFPTKPGELVRNANARKMAEALGGAVFDKPGKPHEWFREILDWALGLDDYALASEAAPTHLCQLQDDVKLAPHFADALRAIVTVYPSQPICLQSVHPAAPYLASAGAHGYTTRDGMIGVGWVLPIEIARRYREWLASDGQEWAPRISEDTLLGLWCAIEGIRIFHPLPTIIDHDTTAPSTYGNDAHPNRRSPVRWDTVEDASGLTNPDFWRMPHVAHLGMYYGQSTPALAQKIAKLSPLEMAELRGDNGALEMRILSHLHRAHELRQAPPTKLYMATPRRGPDSPAHIQSKYMLLREEFCLEDYELVAARIGIGDIVRTRSQFVRSFLEETDAEALLFIDNDVGVSPACVRGMVRALQAHPFVCAPYPRREGINWDRVKKVPNVAAEAVAYQYTVMFPEDMQALKLDEYNCTPVVRAAIGCSLLRRDFLQSLTEKFWDSLTSWDKGTDGWLCFLFKLITSDGEGPPPYAQRAVKPLRPRLELSEDYSFCDRVRSVGYQPMLYLGPGSPADHEGEYLYRGHRGAFGLGGA